VQQAGRLLQSGSLSQYVSGSAFVDDDKAYATHPAKQSGGDPYISTLKSLGIVQLAQNQLPGNVQLTAQSMAGLFAPGTAPGDGGGGLSKGAVVGMSVGGSAVALVPW